MRVIFLPILILLFSCNNSIHFIKYAYLPVGDYEFYAPISKVDLKQKRFCYIVNDMRSGINRIECSGSDLDRNTKLEGRNGLDYFSNYIKAMTEYNNGIVDQNSNDTIYVDLLAISSQTYGFGFERVYGHTKFKIHYNGLQKDYCAEITDGDNDSPLGLMSFSTRKGALRKLASASVRKALEMFIQDLEKEIN